LASAVTASPITMCTPIEPPFEQAAGCVAQVIVPGSGRMSMWRSAPPIA
jgi:hypothetical protein